MHLRHTLLLASATSALLGLTGVAAASDFLPGNLFLHSPGLPGVIGAGGIVRIDPYSGAVSTFLGFPGQGGLGYPGALAYDSYRDRLIFTAQMDLNDPVKLWLADGNGGLTDLGAVPIQYDKFAPGAGGKIYMASASAGPYGYLDASNVYHTLLDASGSAPFVPPGDVSRMLYDAGTNALFMASSSLSPWSCGSNLNLNVHRVRLSSDGTRVVASDDCFQVVVAPGGDNNPVGLTRGPGQTLLLTVDDNSGGALPRMNLIDPQTLAVTPYASNSNVAAAATNAGTYSSALDKAVILDTGANVLVAFGQNEVGPGVVLTLPDTVSGQGSGETATLIEFPLEPCGPGITAYCTAAVNSTGAGAHMATNCRPSVAMNELELEASPVPNQPGLFFYSSGQTAGGAGTPFGNGYRCVGAPGAPIFRLPVIQASGGRFSYTPDLSSPPSASGLIHGGSTWNFQCWYRDPLGAGSSFNLSDGIVISFTP